MGHAAAPIRVKGLEGNPELLLVGVALRGKASGSGFIPQARAGKALGRGVPTVVEVGIAASRGGLAGQEQDER